MEQKEFLEQNIWKMDKHIDSLLFDYIDDKIYWDDVFMADLIIQYVKSISELRTKLLDIYFGESTEDPYEVKKNYEMLSKDYDAKIEKKIDEHIKAI